MFIYLFEYRKSWDRSSIFKCKIIIKRWGYNTSIYRTSFTRVTEFEDSDLTVRTEPVTPKHTLISVEETLILEPSGIAHVYAAMFLTGLPWKKS